MAELGNMRGKVFLQIDDGELIEVCTLLIPVKAGNAKHVGHSVNLEINTALNGVPQEVSAKIRDLATFAI